MICLLSSDEPPLRAGVSRGKPEGNMFTLLFAVMWQFILFVIIVSAVCYIGYWGLVGLALIVYAP